MDRQRVQKRRTQNYRRLSGVAKLDAGLASADGVKSYTHVLGVIWVGEGSVNHCIGGNTGEGAALASVRSVGVSSASDCGRGYDR
jgi:hypothetical protein